LTEFRALLIEYRADGVVIILTKFRILLWIDFVKIMGSKRALLMDRLLWIEFGSFLVEYRALMMEYRGVEIGILLMEFRALFDRIQGSF